MLLKTFIFVLLLVVAAKSTEWYLENNPTFLNEQNIGDQILANGPIKIVHFMEPKCHYCPQMKPHLERLERQLKDDQQVTAKFYQLDCQKSSKLCDDFKITKLPYLIVFNKQGRVIQQLPGQRQSFRFTIQKIEQAIFTMESRQYQQKRLSLLKHIRSQGHGNDAIQIPKKVANSQQKKQEEKPLQTNINKIKQTQQPSSIRNNLSGTLEKKEQNLSPCNQKINLEDLLPHQSRAKVVEEVLNTRERRSIADKLKITSKIGIVVMIIFFVAMAIYLKSIIASISTKRIYIRGKEYYSPQDVHDPYTNKKEYAKNSV